MFGRRTDVNANAMTKIVRIVGGPAVSKRVLVFGNFPEKRGQHCPPKFTILFFMTLAY